jgi:hypothetical protein
MGIRRETETLKVSAGIQEWEKMSRHIMPVPNESATLLSARHTYDNRWRWVFDNDSGKIIIYEPYKLFGFEAYCVFVLNTF